ncbi:MAG: prepilin-type N-terminal cleavage/methylation domain-containing protein [Candidatus Staskawiczbacteria bacterium]|nr:prepilin-type N-terminal cleavage/methylation domain-containing protein [Candidatus Staskawiczbacteria bacterium]
MKCIINNKNGFTIIEILVSLTVFSFVLLVVISSLFFMTDASYKTKADREALDNARRAMEIITSEIKGAESIYTPTTTANQLSLKTRRYLLNDENTTFIDIFLCGQAICLKKEFQGPVSLISDSVEAANLSFSQIFNNGRPSVKIDLTIDYKNTTNNPNNDSSVSLSSTVSLRSY